MNNLLSGAKRFLFFFLSSFILAVAVYYILWLILPNHHVFGSWYRMVMYHNAFPISYIAIVCIVYASVASLFSSRFAKQNRKGQLALTALIILLTVILSSPLGGMLWHYHDMQAGYFPSQWQYKLLSKGFSEGLSLGWIILGLSIPYNIIGIVVCFHLTKKGSHLFRTQ